MMNSENDFPWFSNSQSKVSIYFIYHDNTAIKHSFPFQLCNYQKQGVDYDHQSADSSNAESVNLQIPSNLGRSTVLILVVSENVKNLILNSSKLEQWCFKSGVSQRLPRTQASPYMGPIRSY
jgi:hypothetical protein